MSSAMRWFSLRTHQSLQWPSRLVCRFMQTYVVLTAQLHRNYRELTVCPLLFRLGCL